MTARELTRAVFFVDDGLEALKHHPSPDATPDEVAMMRDDAAHLQRAIAMLPPRAQYIVWAVHAESRSCRSVARDAGLSAPTACRILHAAERFLRATVKH